MLFQWINIGWSIWLASQLMVSYGNHVRRLSFFRHSETLMRSGCIFFWFIAATLFVFKTHECSRTVHTKAVASTNCVCTTTVSPVDSLDTDFAIVLCFLSQKHLADVGVCLKAVWWWDCLLPLSDLFLVISPCCQTSAIKSVSKILLIPVGVMARTAKINSKLY